MRTIVPCVGRVEPEDSTRHPLSTWGFGIFKERSCLIGKVRDIAITSSVNGERSLF